MEIFETKPEEQQTDQYPQQDYKLMRTCVTCPENISTLGKALPYSIKNCLNKCKDFIGVSLEDPSNPKIMCKNSDNQLGLLVHVCKREGNVTTGKVTKLCLQCSYFKGFDDLTKQVKCSFQTTKKPHVKKPTFGNNKDSINLQLTELQGTQEVTTTGISAYVMCCKNQNRMGLHIQTTTNRCKSCPDFCSIVYTEKSPPKLLCKGTGMLKSLTLFNNCHTKFNRNLKISTCQRCSQFTSFNPSTGCMDCASIKHKTERTVLTFPKRDLQVQYPFLIPCAKRHGETVTFDECLTNCSTFFRGLYGSPAKVCCSHSKAIDSLYVVRKHPNVLKKPRQKILKTPCIRWLFEEYTDSKHNKRLKINVVCSQIRVNCIASETSLEVCKTNCSAYAGLDNFKTIKCKTETKPLLFIHCPNCNEGIVLLQNCRQCNLFQEIKDEKVVCAHSKEKHLLRINKPPITKHRNLKISPLTGKPKQYIDVEGD
jgi:hypothetical protein